MGCTPEADQLNSGYFAKFIAKRRQETQLVNVKRVFKKWLENKKASFYLIYKIIFNYYLILILFNDDAVTNI